MNIEEKNTSFLNGEQKKRLNISPEKFILTG